MFSRHPFSYFADEFQYLDPWTSWGYNRTPPRQQHRRRGSADPEEIFRRNYRKRQPAWTTPFLEFPSQYEDENLEEKNSHTAQQKACYKCRHKSGCPECHPTARANDSQETACSNDITIRMLGTEGINEMEEENPSNDKSEKYEAVEQGYVGKKIDETEEKMRIEPKEESKEDWQPNEDENQMENQEETDIKDKSKSIDDQLKQVTKLDPKEVLMSPRNDQMETELEEEMKEDLEQPSEDEHPENKMEDQEGNIEGKIKLIDEQLEKARELVPKEVLMSPRTDKQKLYLTEMLLRCILDLDAIETRGNETVKQRRREVVRKIQSYLDVVENES